jgi:hypothetical protein
MSVRLNTVRFKNNKPEAQKRAAQLGLALPLRVFWVAAAVWSRKNWALGRRHQSG